MSKRLIAPILCVLLTAPALAQTAPLQFQCDGVHLLQARQKFLAHDPAIVAAVRKIVSSADSMIKDGPFTIVHKLHPLAGVDPHDYVSLAPYYWPNPKTPSGLPYIRKDGQRNPEIHQYDAKPFSDMSKRVWTLALAGYLSGDSRYSNRAVLLIRVWFFDPQTRMNPNLDHAQLVEGTDLGRGTGIIESCRLLPVIDAVELLRLSSAWTPQDDASMIAWFRAYTNWMMTSRNGKAESAATNNHGVWYDDQLMTYLLFLNDPADARRVAQTAATKRIAAQIRPTGQMPRELGRTNAFSYSVFNLNAFTLLADLAQRVHVDLWHFKTQDGRCIQAAIDWMLPYATGRQKWGYQQISGKIDASGLVVPLRRVSYALNDPAYEAVIPRLKGVTSADNLRYPPIFKSPTTPVQKSPDEEEEPPTGD
ncbi:MAG TPA: alginate lyase family protein [Tepidisphaeraceae bacterium]|nr:alginate lyase family protein [Tepidisphaeraceae bacterium]